MTMCNLKGFILSLGAMMKVLGDLEMISRIRAVKTSDFGDRYQSLLLKFLAGHYDSNYDK